MSDVVMIGGGNMGAALLGGMIESGRFDPASLAVVERLDERRLHLEDRFPAVIVTDEVPPCAAAVIAVKPDGVSAAVEAAVAAGARRVLSIAAGVTLATLVEAAGEAAVVRAMPNTPALVGLGCAAIAGSPNATDDDLGWAEEILGAVGIVERVDEHMLDAFTGVAGSGPAYVFLLAETLIAAAVEQGFEARTAERIVTQLLVGSSALLAREGDPAQLRINVTSPGGTTAAGLARFEHHGLADIIADVVNAATKRSRELG
ncbi:MAG: pyrroline-5-carboxylate reductase [Ilumatobacter sp.]